MRSRLLPLRLCEDTRSDEETDRKSLRPHTDLHDLLRGGLVPTNATQHNTYTSIHHAPYTNTHGRGYERNTHLSRAMIAPATAILSAQPPARTEYWFLMVQSFNFCEGVRVRHRNSSSDLLFSITAEPASFPLITYHKNTRFRISTSFTAGITEGTQRTNTAPHQTAPPSSPSESHTSAQQPE